MHVKKVRIKIEESKVSRMSRFGGDIDQSVKRAAGWVRDEGKRIVRNEGRTDTGRLQNSIESWYHQRLKSGVVYRAGSQLNYAIYQHEGVKGPVFPRRARFLRFKPKGSSTFVFARSVSGFSGIKFMERAKNRLTTSKFAK